MEEKVFTVEEVTKALKISRVMTYRLIKSGKLKAIHIGRHWRMPKKSLDEFLSGNQNEESVKD